MQNIYIYIGDSEGQEGSLVRCSPWGCKELDMTEQLNNNSWLCKLVEVHRLDRGQMSSMWGHGLACVPSSAPLLWGWGPGAWDLARGMGTGLQNLPAPPSPPQHSSYQVYGAGGNVRVHRLVWFCVMRPRQPSWDVTLVWWPERMRGQGGVDAGPEWGACRRGAEGRRGAGWLVWGKYEGKGT